MPSFAPNSSCPSGASICLPPCKKRGSFKYARTGTHGKCELDSDWLNSLPASRKEAILASARRNKNRSKSKNRPYASSQSYKDAIDAVVRNSTAVRRSKRKKTKRRK